jgi:DNA-binding transcriptional regulator LsrR (DeoR family)
MVRAARLLYDEKMTQKDISTKLGVSQATVSRLIELAQDKGIIRIEIIPTRRVDLEESLKTALEPWLIRDVRVVPTGDAKNIDNLGPAGAQLLLDRIRDIEAATVKPSKIIRITISCGETLRAVFDNFIQRIRAEDAPPTNARNKTTLEFYPNALHADYHLKDIYPSTLVSTLSTVSGLHAFTIEAYSTSLPHGFHALPPDKRTAFLNECRIPELILNKAAAADVFVLGIGTTDNESYQGLVGRLGLSLREKDKSRFIAEIGYMPVDRDGQHSQDVAEKIVGMSLDQLRAAAATPDRHVIAIAGGVRKKEAVEAVIKARCCNTLLTDESIAEHLLGVFAPPRR